MRTVLKQSGRTYTMKARESSSCWESCDKNDLSIKLSRVLALCAISVQCMPGLRLHCNPTPRSLAASQSLRICPLSSVVSFVPTGIYVPACRGTDRIS